MNNNFGNFGVSGGDQESHPLFSTSNYLESAKREIETGTPDSLSLAVEILRKQQITLPSLEQLKELQEKTNPNNRDSDFHQKTKDLQQKVLQEIQKLMNEN